MKRTFRLGPGWLAAIWLGAAGMAAGPPQPPKDERAALQEFQERLDAYVGLHTRLEASLAPLLPSADMRVVAAHQKAMAGRLRAARPNARQGEIFTPAAATVLRERIVAALKDCDIDELLADLEQEHPSAARLKPRVNASYPHGAFTNQMPASLMRVLPPLAGDVEYRLMHRHLLLWDIHANLVIDFIPEAVPVRGGDTRKGCREDQEESDGRRRTTGVL